MRRYETLFIAVPEITNDEIKGIESQFSQTVQAAKGSLISFERWGKFKLAYPIRKNEYGVYFLVRFELETEPKGLLDDLRRLLAVKHNELIMRNITVTLDPNASLEYQRPESLEEAPREVSSFMRDGGYRNRRPDYSRPAASDEKATIESEM